LVQKTKENKKHIKILEFLTSLHYEMTTMVVPTTRVQQVVFTPHKYSRKKLLNFLIIKIAHLEFCTALYRKSDHHGYALGPSQNWYH
jgi:hypothetical protein